MTKQELNAALNQSLQEFINETKCVASDPYGKRPVTEGELYESNKQIFYALDKFKDILLDYLD